MNRKVRKVQIFLLPILMIVISYPLTGKSLMLRVGIPAFPLTLHPFYVTDETSQAVINKMFDSLYYFDTRGMICKQLAAKEELTQNGDILEVKLTLKQNVYFSNGQKLDAEDVVRTIEIMKNPEFHYPYLSILSIIVRVEQTDTYQLKLSLKQPPAEWRGMLSFKILCKKDLDTVDYSTFRHSIPAGTGPYKVEKSQPPDKIRLEQNPYYEKCKNMYHKLDYVVVAYNHLTPLKLLAGEIDIVELPLENAQAYKNIKSWQHMFEIIKYKKTGFTCLIFNGNNSRLTTNIRKIFYNVLTAGDFVQRFLKGGGELVISPFQTLCPLKHPVKLDYRPLKQPITLSILTNSESRIRRNFILLLRRAVKPLGIHLEPVFLEYHTMLNRLKKGACDMALFAYRLDTAQDIHQILHSDSPLNYSGYKLEKLDHLLDIGIKAVDENKRQKLYSEAHAIWLDNLPILPVFNLYYYVGISKKITLPEELIQTVGSSSDFLSNITDWKPAPSTLTDEPGRL